MLHGFRGFGWVLGGIFGCGVLGLWVFWEVGGLTSVWKDGEEGEKRWRGIGALFFTIVF